MTNSDFSSTITPPHHWKILTVGQLADLINGKAFKPSEWRDQGIPIIRIQNLNGGEDYNYFNGVIDKKYSVENNQLLFSWSGSRGTSFGPFIWKGDEALLNQHIFKVIVKDESQLDKKFFFYQLKMVTNEIEQQAHGSAGLVHVTKKFLEKINIYIPPLSDQRKIAEILSTVDDKIDISDAQISKTQELKKGLMQQLLTKGIGHTKFKDSPLGEIPESWRIETLSDYTEKIGDGLHSTPKYVSLSEYFFINGNNLVNGKIVVNEKTKCISAEEYSKHFREFNSNTILMSINGTIGNLAFYNGEKVILGKSAAYLTCSKGLDKEFLFYFLQTSQINEYFENELTGTTIRNLSLKSIRKTPIPIPEIEEQENIAYILRTVDTKIEMLVKKREHMTQLKTGLMQQLLTGKIRVNQPNALNGSKPKVIPEITASK